MSNEIKIPPEVAEAAHRAGYDGEDYHDIFAQVVANWMREECAKIVKKWRYNATSEQNALQLTAIEIEICDIGNTKRNQ